ncbi:MAG: hypothetical protein GX142_08390 [Chloroflexi bacterium]|nr:hypothetical protein [Chloroflexota bacterium]
MTTSFIFDKKVRKAAQWLLLVGVIITLGAQVVAHAAMTSGYRVEVTNVTFHNKNGLKVRGKLYRPKEVSVDNPAPGIVYLHGYQNNRETSDPYAIELSRRGFVVITLDALGRGNSDNQFSEDEPGFDPTYGADSAFTYLQNLPFVDAERCGLAGHSLGGEWTYLAAMQNPEVKAISYSGFAYREDATTNHPQNMLMIFGKYDEYRQRMTETRDFEAEWMLSPQTKAAFGTVTPRFNTTYGDFSDGSARQVYMTHTTHVGESFDKGAIAATVDWFNQAFYPNVPLTIPAEQQIWRIKEFGSLVAMLAGIFSIIPAGILLLGIKPFSAIVNTPSSIYRFDKKTFKNSYLLNTLLTLLFLPLVMVIFGFHVYVVHIDRAFPMMMVNGVIFWFLVRNIIGYFNFHRWVKKESPSRPEVNYKELGVSDTESRVHLHWSKVWRMALLAIVLFAFIYILEALPEAFLMVDFRYKFPYVSDMTPYRWLMMLLYFPLFLVGFIHVNMLLQAQLRPAPGKTWFHTMLRKSLIGIGVVLPPLLLIMAVQYIPLFTIGFVPFVGPGGALVGFVINIESMVVLLALMIPLGSFLYEATGSVYPGAILNALIVTWAFTSSSVIAPLPV